jgi:hypothetical protein
MLLCKVTRIHAGASRVLHQCHKRAHLIDGEAKLATAPDERQALHIGIAVDALIASLTARRPKQSDFLVIPDRRRTRAGLARAPILRLLIYLIFRDFFLLEPQVT